jgi:tetratricopeptide (TPR) repeat protein
MSSLSNHDRELQTYFTDVEHLRELFKQWLAAPTLPKRMLVIHGVGGVGKSSLLRMFRLHCKSVGVPVALASGDEQKSALDVLTRWADDLKADGVALPEFGKTFQQYRAIQAKVENEATKVAGKLAKGAAATVVETVASTIPGIGPLVGKLGGMGAEALVDWLRGFLSKPDIDLLLDPAKKLTADFLADLEKVASKRRIVLMLDTFEQMTVLDDWAREVAQGVGQISNLPVGQTSNLSYGALLVIAGRALPNWSRAWSGWMANAQVEELKPMSEEMMRELIRRYYATLRGGEPDPKQVEAIIRFARGLPMVVTGAVQLWVKYGVEDFQAVKPEIVANLVDRLMEGVPKGMVPALEAAAAVRWFDQPILRAVMAQEDVREVYNELRRFPFVRTRAEGLALHDAVREMVDENLRMQDAERHRELHERAAAYFEKRLEKATGEEAERLGLERLYHCIRADEEAGIQLFQEMAEELVRYRMVNRLRALLNDVNTYPLERENSRLWREYYNARLAHLEARWAEAESTYQAIGENEKCDPKLRAYALCDWGSILKRREILYKEGGIEKALQTLQRSLDLTALDPKLACSLVYISDVYSSKAEYHKATEFLEQARQFFSERNDFVGVIDVLLQERGIYGRQHDFRKVLVVQQQIWKAYNDAGAPSYLQPRCAAPLLDLIWMGRYADGEKERRPGLNNARTWMDNEVIIGYTRDLGFALGMQGKCKEALPLLEEGLEIAQKLGELGKLEVYMAESLRGIIFLKCGDLVNSEMSLMNALKVGEELHAHLDHGLLYTGVLYEMMLNFERAEHFYRRSQSEANQLKRHYFECGALTGLTRVKHAQGEYAAIPPLLAEAEQLAQQYEYNDHLASLRLTQGHIAWEGHAPTWENGFDAALRYYQHALIYALRYNRFLLDEVLSGRPQGTPLRPIILECLKRGEEGRQMLIALRDWWQTGINDIGTPRPDTISPIPEGIPLLEAERIAREREPGDGSPQKSVVEQIESVL